MTYTHIILYEQGKNNKTINDSDSSNAQSEAKYTQAEEWKSLPFLKARKKKTQAEKLVKIQNNDTKLTKDILSKKVP